MDELATSAHLHNAVILFPWNPDLATEEGSRLSSALRVLRIDLTDLQKKARSARIQGAYAARIVRGILASLSELRSDQGRGTLFDRLSVELNIVPSQSPEHYLSLHRTFISNVIAGERNLAIGARRDATLHKWVIGQASAAEILSFM